jgi:hypothetical protein
MENEKEVGCFNVCFCFSFCTSTGWPPMFVFVMVLRAVMYFDTYMHKGMNAQGLLCCS